MDKEIKILYKEALKNKEFKKEKKEEEPTGNIKTNNLSSS